MRRKNQVEVSLRRSVQGRQIRALRLINDGHESPTLPLDIDGRTVCALFRKRLVKRSFMGVKRLTRLGERVLHGE